jgi:hypothetical protein
LYAPDAASGGSGLQPDFGFPFIFIGQVSAIARQRFHDPDALGVECVHVARQAATLGVALWSGNLKLGK